MNYSECITANIVTRQFIGALIKTHTKGIALDTIHNG